MKTLLVSLLAQDQVGVGRKNSVSDRHNAAGSFKGGDSKDGDCIGPSIAPVSNDFQEEFVTEIVKTMGELLHFGFFHSFDALTGQQMLDITELRDDVMTVLLNVLDTRHISSKKGASALNQSFRPDENSVTDKRNVEVLMLCNRFMDFTLADAAAKVVCAWEALLSDHLECPDLSTGMRSARTHTRAHIHLQIQEDALTYSRLTRSFVCVCVCVCVCV